MSQESVSNLLRKAYPRYIGYKEIQLTLNLSKRSILNNLEKLRSRDEIEYSMQFINGICVKMYREKKENLI